MHKFQQQHSKFVDQVKRHRDKRELTAYSALCSQYLKQLCFMADSMLLQSLGLGKRSACLKPDAVPTLFNKLVSEKRKAKGESLPPKKRSAFEKCERCRVSKMKFN